MLERLQALDLFLFDLINRHAGSSRALDALVVMFTGNDAVKGIPVFMLWWGLWFWRTENQHLVRARLLATLAVSIAAIFIGRLLAVALPFRLRPMHDSGIPVALPLGLDPTVLDGWSSMPSDHAVLFFALATGVFWVHRWAGMLLFAHATFLVSVPRIYAAVHFPGDIVVGAIVGIALTLLLLERIASSPVAAALLRIEARWGYVFYPAVFLVTVQAATMFASSRGLVADLYNFSKLLVVGSR